MLVVRAPATGSVSSHQARNSHVRIPSARPPLPHRRSCGHVRDGARQLRQRWWWKQTAAAKDNPYGLQQAGTLRVGTLTDAPPNVYLKNGKFTGFDNDLFTAVAAKLDLKVQFVGMVFQHFNLFPHKSVLANITLGLRKLRGLSREEADATALAQLDRVGLRHKAQVRPGVLSGGQQQRVAIARALAMSPEVMLFDEATSALDPELVKGVLATIADLAGEGMTMLVVTHEMGFARGVADVVHFMDHGQVLESGPPEQLFEAASSRRLQDFLSQVL